MDSNIYNNMCYLKMRKYLTFIFIDWIYFSFVHRTIELYQIGDVPRKYNQQVN